MKTHLACLSLDHTHASIALRELVAWFLEQHLSYLELFKRAHPNDIHELFLLSTCNRTELYVAGSEDAPARLRELLVSHARTPRLSLAMQVFSGSDATRHALRVASGLESMALGESEILGQVRAALGEMQDHGLCGPAINRLMQLAIATGKRVRNKTRLGVVPTSVAGLAAMRAENLHDKNVLVLGAGVMARSFLASSNAKNIVVVNRSQERAETLARAVRGQAAPFEDLPRLLPNADVIVGAVRAKEPVLGPHHGTHIKKPVVIFDLGLPRNVNPALGAHPHVTLYNLDDLAPEAAKHRHGIAKEIPKAELIVNAALEDFERWLVERAGASHIAAAVAEAEMWFMQELARLDENDRKRFEVGLRKRRNAMRRAAIARIKSYASEGLL